MFQIVWIIFTKINGAGVGKLKAVPIDLDKLSDVIDNQVVKNTKFNTLKTKVINLEQKIPEATTLIDINQHNTDEQNLEQKIKDVDKKMPDISGLVNTTALNTKNSEVDNKITAKTFKEKLKQTDLVSKNNFDNKLISFNKRITLNKTKYLEVQKKLNSLKIKDYIFFLDRIYFTSDDGSQHLFVYQPTLDSLQFKKAKVLIMLLVWNQRYCILLNVRHCILLSWIALNFLDIEWK